jgi:glycosyltransferase involved in cell wall biosynthesis
LARVLDDVDLVEVENLCTIPLNLPAARALAGVLAGRPAILHHHDPPWQRERFRRVTELPPDDPAWRHVTINELTRAQFGARGLRAVTIYNGFDAHQTPGDRVGTRARLGVAEGEILVAHPVRAIARKDVGAAVRLCEALDATYWLLGPAEEGYRDELERILGSARCRVIRQPLPHGPDIYAAPDLVAFPSTWEGFGNPPIEAALARRLGAVGFVFFAADDVDRIRSWLTAPDPDLLEHNRRVAEEHFSLEVMDGRLRALLDEAGWYP